MTVVPPPAPPPDRWGPPSSEPRRSQGPIIAAICVGVVLAIGATVGLVGQLGDEDTEAGSGSTPAVEAAFPDPAEVDLDAPEYTSHQVTLTFNQDVGPAIPRQVERDWRANPDLDGIYTLGDDEVEAATGYPLAGIISWFTGDDLDDVERFACGYAGQPGVAMVGIDDTPCDTSEPDPPEVVIEIRVGEQVSVAHRETIRHAMEGQAFFDDLTLEGGNGDPGTWTQLRLGGFVPGAAFVCPDAAAFVGDPGVRVREIGPVDGCPEF